MANHTPKTADKDTAEDAGKKAVNITIEENLYWEGREHAARARLPNISTLLERLLKKEIENPTLAPRRLKKAA